MNAATPGQRVILDAAIDRRVMMICGEKTEVLIAASTLVARQETTAVPWPAALQELTLCGAAFQRTAVERADKVGIPPMFRGRSRSWCGGSGRAEGQKSRWMGVRRWSAGEA